VYYIEVSLNGLVDIKPYDVKVMEEKCASQVLSKEGIALNQLNKEKPFFALFPRLENKNYNAFLKNKEKMLSFLKELSNDDFFNALILKIPALTTVSPRIYLSRNYQFLLKEQRKS
jgi:hypothetical protein